jgi:hypothetical protein
MLRRIRKWPPSPAMVVAFVALIAAMSGTAVALPGKNSVDSGDLKNGAVKNADIGKNAVTGSRVKNNSLKGADIVESSLGKVRSAGTADSATTAANSGKLGGKGPSAYLQYNATIPRGVTVIGNWYAAPSNGPSTSGFDEVDLPALAPADILDTESNMGAGTVNGSDNDATCTGTDLAPTAPAGKLCFYVGFQTGLSDLSAYFSNGNKKTGGAVRVVGSVAAGNKYARGSWAYTAP